MMADYISMTHTGRLTRTCPSRPRRAFGSLPKALYAHKAAALNVQYGRNHLAEELFFFNRRSVYVPSVLLPTLFHSRAERSVCNSLYCAVCIRASARISRHGTSLGCSMNHAITATACKNRIRRRRTLTPPQLPGFTPPLTKLYRYRGFLGIPADEVSP